MVHALFVENDRASLTIYQTICEQANIDFTGIQDSTQVLVALDQLVGVDVIFLDIDMPKMNGYQILKIIKSHPQFQHTPVVACTVYGNEFETAHRADFNGFITKPIDIDLFASQIISIADGNDIWQIHTA